MAGNEDGSLVLGVDITASKAYKQLAKLKDKIADIEQELSGKRERQTAVESELNAAKKEALETEKAIQQLNREIAELRAIGDMSGIENPFGLNDLLEELKQQEAILKKQDAETKRLDEQYAKITRELKDYQKALSETGDVAEAQVSRTALAMEKFNSIISKLSPEFGGKTSEITGKLLPLLETAAPRSAEKIAPALESITAAVDALASKLAIILAVIKLVWSAAKKMLGELRDTLQGMASALGKAGSVLGDWLSNGMDAAKKFGSTATVIFSKITKNVSVLMKRINVFSKLFDALGGTIKRMGNMIKRVFVFSLITSGLRSVRTQMAAYLNLNEQFTTALRRLQGVLLTAFQPIYDVIVPALTTFIRILSRAIAAVTQFFASLFGTTGKKAQSSAKALYEEANALKAAGSAAEEAAGSLAGFDEINTIQTENKNSGSGGADADAGPLFDWEYDDTPFDSWGEAFSAFLDKLLNGIPKLEEAFKNFADWLNDLAKKLYDMFKYPGVYEKVKQLGRDLAGAFNKLVNWIDWEMLGRALGAGLNLALNFLTSFLYAFDWMNLGRKLAEFVNGLVAEIEWYEFGRLLWAGFKIALETLAGFILGLNMPLMAEAASDTILGFFDEMYNTIERIPWYEIGEQIAVFLNNIKWYEVITSVSAAIFAAVRAAFELLKGFIETLKWHDIAVQIYTAINDSLGSVNWGDLGRTLGGAFIHIFDFVREIIAGINWGQIGRDIGAFLVGIDWKGVAESVFGAIKAAFTASSDFFIGLLGEELKRTLTDLMILLGESLLAIGAILTFTGANVPLGLSLMAKGALSLAAAAVLDWEYVSGNIKKIMGDILTLIGSSFMVIGAVLAFSGANIPLGIGLMAGGAASLAAALAVNWDSLKSNISAALSVITGLVSGSLLAVGALLCCSGVDVPLGLSLIAAGAAGLFTVGALNWGALLGKLKEVWQGIIDGFKSFFGINSPSTVFAELGNFLVEGLLKGIADAVKSIGAWLKEHLVDPLVNGFKNLLGIHSPSTVFTEIGGNLVAGLLLGLTQKWADIVNFFGEKIENIKKTLSDAWENIKTTATEKWENIKTALREKWEKICDTAREKFSKVKDKVSEAWESIKKEIPRKWDEIKTALKGKWDGIVSSAKTWGGDLCSSLASGIKGAIGKVTSAAKSVADKISSYLHFSEPDIGPLSNFHTFMPDMLELMAKGIEDNTHLAANAASNLADSIANAVSGKRVGVNVSMPDISKFSLPLIAQGAALPSNREFMTVVQSDGGGAALERIEKMLGTVLTRMEKRNEIVIHNETKLDGKLVAKNTVHHINDMTRAAGKSVLLF